MLHFSGMSSLTSINISLPEAELSIPSLYLFASSFLHKYAVHHKGCGTKFIFKISSVQLSTSPTLMLLSRSMNFASHFWLIISIISTSLNLRLASKSSIENLHVVSGLLNMNTDFA